MAKLAKTKFDVLKDGINLLDDYMSNAGCNDYTVANTPELWLLAEESAADNLHMTLEDFKTSDIYEDEKPRISKDGTKIYLHDSFVLYLIKKELKLK